MLSRDEEVIFETRYETLEMDGGMVSLDGNEEVDTGSDTEDFWAFNPDILKWFSATEDFEDDKVEIADPRDLFVASSMLCIIAIGYALPWIAVGSLVSYFTAEKGCRYFVAVYVAYYLPGLPVAMAQTRYDQRFDVRFTSAVTFAARGAVNWALTLLLVALMRPALLSPGAMLPLTAALGVTTWCLHGSASQLAQLLPQGRGVIAQQVGFALPALFALGGVALFGIRADATTEAALDQFFVSIEVVVLLGAAAWVVLLRRPVLLRALQNKDKRGRRATVEDQAVNEREGSGCSVGGGGGGSSRGVPEKGSSLHRGWFKAGTSEEPLVVSASNPTYVGASTLNGSSTRLFDSEEAATKAESVQSNGHDRQSLLKGELSASERRVVARKIRPALVSLSVTIFCSVFSAAFFPYVPSENNSWDLPQLLYFVRLAADLLG